MCKNNIIRAAKKRVRSLLNSCTKCLSSGDSNQISNLLQTIQAEAPGEISLSLCRRTNQEFKGGGCYKSKQFELEDSTAQLKLLIEDYHSLLDYIEGFEYAERKETSTQIKESITKLVPWILAILPYIVQIIKAFRGSI